FVFRNAAAFENKAFQKGILKAGVGRDRSHRVEDCKKNGTTVACVSDTRQRAHTSIGTRKGSGFADDCASELFSNKSPPKRAGIAAGDRKHVLRLQVTQVQSEHEFTKQLDGGSLCNALEVMPRCATYVDGLLVS